MAGRGWKEKTGWKGGVIRKERVMKKGERRGKLLMRIRTMLN